MASYTEGVFDPRFAATEVPEDDRSVQVRLDTIAQRLEMAIDRIASINAGQPSELVNKARPSEPQSVRDSVQVIDVQVERLMQHAAWLERVVGRV